MSVIWITPNESSPISSVQLCMFRYLSKIKLLNRKDYKLKIGYVRVSTVDQNLDLQIDALKAYGCDEIFEDKLIGIAGKRTSLEKALQYVRPGDSLVVWRLDRLGRTMHPLIQIVNE